MNGNILDKNNKITNKKDNDYQQLSPQSSLLRKNKYLIAESPSYLSFTLTSDNKKVLDDLNLQIEEKKNKISHLTKTNQKQKEAFENLTKQIEELQQNEILQSGQRQKSQSKEDDIQIQKEKQLSIEKEKMLSSAISQINLLSKGNKELKRDAGINGEYHNKIEVLDKNKMKIAQIDDLKNEIKYLTKELEEHKACITHRESLTSRLKSIKDEIKKAKQTYIALKQKYNEAEAQYNKATSNIQEKSIGKIKQNDLNSISKRSISPTNIISKNKPITKTYPYPNALLSNEERQLIQEKMNNEKEYTDLINKIAKLETMRTTLESKQNHEMRQCKAKIANQLEEIDEIVKKNKENESKNRILMNSLNELKNEQKVSQKKLTDLQSQKETLVKTLKEKNQELNLLSHQLDAYKKVSQLDDRSQDNEIENMMNKIKKDQSSQLNSNSSDRK